MSSKHRISTAYIRLMLAAEPLLANQLTERFATLAKQASDLDYIDADIVEELFPAMQAIGVESIALRFSRQIQLNSHGAVGFAALSAPDLRSALETVSRFTSIRSTLIQTTIEQDSNILRILSCIPTEHALVKQWMAEVSIDTTYAVVETIMAHDISAQTRIGFAHSRPPYATQLDEKYGIKCQYDQAQNYICVPASWSDVKSPLSDPTSFRDNVAKCQSLLLNLDAKRDSAALVKHTLERFFEARYTLYSQTRSNPRHNLHYTGDQAPTLSAIAGEMAVSSRTLIRKLSARGTSYSEQLNSVRDELALQWLRSTHLNINEIADLLAYKEAANFTRAFKQRQGCSPMQWRKRDLA